MQAALAAYLTHPEHVEVGRIQGPLIVSKIVVDTPVPSVETNDDRDSLQQEIDVLTETSNGLSEERDTLLEEIDVMMSYNVELKEEGEEKDSRIGELQLEQQLKDSKIDELELAQQEIVQERDTLIDEVNSLMSLVQEMNDELKQLREHSHRMSQESVAAQAALRADSVSAEE